MRRVIASALLALSAFPAHAVEKTLSCNDLFSCARLVANLNYFVNQCGGTLSPDPRAQFASRLVTGGGVSVIEMYEKDVAKAAQQYGKDGICKGLTEAFTGKS